MKYNVDLNRTYLFIKIVEAGNLTRAASLLNEPKAKLSRNLALLEEELGVQLVYRTTRQFKLTQAGMNYYHNSKDHMKALIQAFTDLREEEEEVSGLLRITAPDDIGVQVVSKIIKEFSVIYPKVFFELIYSNDLLDLVKEGVDLAFRVGHLKDSSLIHKKIAKVEFCLASSPKYLQRSHALEEIDDLHQHQTIGFLPSNAQGWKISTKNKKKTIRLKHKFLVNNYQVIRDLIRDGHGIGYLPRFLCQKELSSGEMVQILKQWGDEGSPLQIAVPQQKKISSKVRAFMDFSAKKCLEYF